MDSDIIKTIFEWTIVPLVASVAWIFRKILFLDSAIEVLKSESAHMTNQIKLERAELLNAIRDHNTAVLHRLTSIEEHLRNGKPK